MHDFTVLGFDFGMKRIGVAVGKTLVNISQALQTLKALDGVPDWQQLEKLIDE